MAQIILSFFKKSINLFICILFLGVGTLMSLPCYEYVYSKIDNNKLNIIINNIPTVILNIILIYIYFFTLSFLSSLLLSSSFKKSILIIIPGIITSFMYIMFIWLEHCIAYAPDIIPDLFEIKLLILFFGSSFTGSYLALKVRKNKNNQINKSSITVSTR
jgi:hypothetical protein